MHEKLVHASPAVVYGKGPILLYFNARAHVSQETSKKLSDLGFEILPRSASDMSPADYHFFENLDSFIKGRVLKKQIDAKNSFNEFIASETQDLDRREIYDLVL
ncbi:hypothetical protein Y032_0141g2244 [Ancylostoma ceylanicum]|uniref:Uncharacterized protein n=1 Tax=Ancylostoma ceylanicum TaxID=53326 RepID=A0A016T3Y4_9BILA|nr:hypothetical protein Y032_0141g2244 [Ancylostoma ceylanicum]